MKTYEIDNHDTLTELSRKVDYQKSREPHFRMSLLLSEWGIYIVSNALSTLLMSITILMGIGICADIALGSMLVLQVIKAVFDNSLAFAIVFISATVILLAMYTLDTVHKQWKRYRY